MLVIKNLPASAEDARNAGLIPGLGRSPGKRKWQPTPVFLPRKSHGERSPAEYNPRGISKESDTTEHNIEVPAGTVKAPSALLSETATPSPSIICVLFY